MPINCSQCIHLPFTHQVPWDRSAICESSQEQSHTSKHSKAPPMLCKRRASKRDHCTQSLEPGIGLANHHCSMNVRWHGFCSTNAAAVVSVAIAIVVTITWPITWPPIVATSLSRDCAGQRLSDRSYTLQVAMAIARVVREVLATHCVVTTSLAALLVDLGRGACPLHVASIAKIAPETVLPTTLPIPLAIPAALTLLQFIALKVGVRRLNAIWLP